MVLVEINILKGIYLTTKNIWDYSYKGNIDINSQF